MKKVFASIAALACLLSLTGCGRTNNTETSKYRLAAAKYPEMAVYPNEMDYIDSKTGEFDDEGFSKVYNAWREDKREQQNQPEGYANGLDKFFSESIADLLSDSNGHNKVYSPLNVCMALAMLAEVTGGSSRQQILDLLGSYSIEALREQAGALWNANYCDDGAVTSILASSLWLNKDVSFVKDTMDSLAEHYYASSYQGEMGSGEFNKALRDWLNEQTGGLLEEQTSGPEMSPETIMALATTICFRAKWSSEFSESATGEGVFHTLNADGEDITCDFMHQSGTRNYYWSDKFSAVAQRLESSGNMWFILPDEDVSVDELLSDSKTVDFILADGDWENSKFLTVNLSLPKFDVVSDTDIVPALKKLGITDVFDAGTSDFTPMTTDTDEIFLSKARHAARVTVDEEGVAAAAYTVMMAAGSAMPPDEEIDFTVDRPFIFAITGADGLPLFVGVVNNPA